MLMITNDSAVIMTKTRSSAIKFVEEYNKYVNKSDDYSSVLNRLPGEDDSTIRYFRYNKSAKLLCTISEESVLSRNMSIIDYDSSLSLEITYVIKGNKVTAVMSDSDGNIMESGNAECSESDEYVYEIGQLLATSRLYDKLSHPKSSIFDDLYLVSLVNYPSLISPGMYSKYIGQFNYKYNMGKIGSETELHDSKGYQLHIGDFVNIKTTYGGYGKNMIVLSKDGNPFIDGYNRMIIKAKSHGIPESLLSCTIEFSRHYYDVWTNPGLMASGHACVRLGDFKL